MKHDLFLSISVTVSILLGAIAGQVKAGEHMENQDRRFQVATFAGGCFWCLEADFAKVEGVLDVTSGYTGGDREDPTYEEVSSGTTGHAEAVQVTYDPHQITYEALVDLFWKHIDPTDPGGQFVDRGNQYRSAIFYHDEQQRRIAEESKENLEKEGPFRRSIATEIVPLKRFYRAEEYHQDYYKKSPVRYTSYRSNSGKDQFLEKTWKTSSRKEARSSYTGSYKRPDDAEIRKRLSPLQYDVTQKDGTEPPFENEYWNHKQDGIYVDIVSGEPLFSSLDKFDSGTGWPSFTQPLEPDNIVEKTDRTLFMVRTEVRSKHGHSHLGHVFPDGPKPRGLRYCINSAALRFIPKEELEKEGYPGYLNLFEHSDK